MLLPRPTSRLPIALAVVGCLAGSGLGPGPADAAARATPAQLRGSVFADRDRDGRRDAGEPTVSGAQVTIERRAGGKPAWRASATRRSGARGTWTYRVPRVGTYRIRVALPPAFSGFSGAPGGKGPAPVGPGGVSSARQLRPGSRSVAYAVGLVARETLAAAPGVPQRPTADGTTAPGAPLPGTGQTAPPGAGAGLPATPTLTPSPAPAPAATPTPTPTPAAPAPPFKISGIAWIDANADGIRQDSEGRVSLAAIHLWTADRSEKLASTQANAFGGWELTVPGDTAYRVSYATDSYAVTGVTRALQGTDRARDSDLSRGESDAYFSAPRAANTPDLHLDAGFGPSTSIGDFVWKDKDADGIQDAGEPGLAGVKVELWDGAREQRLAVDTTDSFGQYKFLGAFFGGAPYRARVLVPVGGTVSPIDQGGDDTDSDVIVSGVSTGWTYTFSPSLGKMAHNGWDAGLH